jgi:hypothetical protein
MKSCGNSIKPSNNPLQEACSGFQEAAWTLEDISKASYTPANDMYTLCIHFKKGKQKFHNYFSLS